jgi:hypothetical protein
MCGHEYGGGDERDRRLDIGDECPVGANATDGELGCSWTPRDLTARAGQAAIVPNAIGIYPTKEHLLSGEPDDGKTMIALIACVEEISAGGTVFYIDLDGMGEEDTYERLHDLGLSDEEISTRFVYLAPDEPLTEPAARAELDRLIAERRPSLVVIDSYTAALELHGLNPDRGNEVQRLHRIMVAPLKTADAGILLIDHLPKSKENRGSKFSIGSERKLGLVHVHLGVEVVTPFGRGRTGLVRLRTKKDRLSRLPRPFACELELRSDPETDALTWTVREATDTESGEAFRPTTLMERVSRHLDQQAEPVSRNDIETTVKGKGPYLRLAMDALVAEGYAEETQGPRNSRLLTSLRPFREHDLVPDLVPTTSRDLVPPRPTTSSPGKPHNQAETPDLVPPRPDLVPQPPTDLVPEPVFPYRGTGSDGTRSTDQSRQAGEPSPMAHSPTPSTVHPPSVSGFDTPRKGERELDALPLADLVGEVLP